MQHGYKDELQFCAGLSHKNDANACIAGCDSAHESASDPVLALHKKGLPVVEKESL